MEVRKLNILLVSFLLVLSSSASALIIVSDLDDTIKVTNTRNLRAAAYNAVFSSKAYAGMPELMNEMNSYTNGLYYVSASPKLLTSRIQRFFRKNNLTVEGFYARSLRQLGDKEIFKINAITDVLETTEEDVILIGDDSELDEKVYQHIKAEFPNRVIATYIHNVYNSEQLTEASRYFTAFDIAVSEYHALRMTLSQVVAISKTLLLEKNMKNYIPNFAYCPTILSEFNSHPLSRVTPLSIAVNTKIVTYCKLQANVD